METFYWPVKPDMGVDSEPKTKTVKFGDGYEQRSHAGLNNDLKKYNVTIRIDRSDVYALESFFSRHGGVSAFLWTPPYMHHQIRVVCRKWSSNVEALKAIFTATFEQVVN
ncbi:phage tail protein [Edwardsiella tarda]